MFILQGMMSCIFNTCERVRAGIDSTGFSDEARFRPASGIVNVSSKRCFYFIMRVNLREPVADSIALETPELATTPFEQRSEHALYSGTSALKT